MTDFKAQGECRRQSLPVDLFVHDLDDPNHEDKAALAKEACRKCPVRAECFLFGVENKEVGMWGGVWLDLPDNPTDFL